MSFTKTYLFTTLLIFPSILTYGQNKASKRLAGFNYQEVVVGDSSNKKLPVLVALHYSSSSPQEVQQYYDSIGIDVRIILPRGNYPKRNGYSWFPKDHYSKDSASQIITTNHTVDSIASFLKKLYAIYPVKPVVSGVSQGGDISLLLALKEPQLLKASLPMLGFIHRTVYEKIKKPSRTIPINLVHGAADEIVGPAYVNKEFAHLKRAGYSISLSIYPSVGHDISPDMERQSNLLLRKWLR